MAFDVTLRGPSGFDVALADATATIVGEPGVVDGATAIVAVGIGVAAPSVETSGALLVTATGQGVAGQPVEVDGATIVTATGGTDSGATIVGAPCEVDGATAVSATGVGVAASPAEADGATTITATGGGTAASGATVSGSTTITALGVATAGSAVIVATSTTVTAAGVGVAASTAATAGATSVVATGKLQTGDAWQDAVWDSAPSAWWRMQDASGVPADYVSGERGMTTKVGATQAYRTGQLAVGVGAYSEDTGSDSSYFTATNPSWLNPQGTAAYSFEAWVSPETWTTAFPRIAYRGYTSPTRHSLDFLWVWDGASVWRFVVQRYVAGVARAVSVNVTPTAGRVWHVVGTYDGANLNLYVDGVAGTPTADARTMPDLTLGPADVRLAQGDARYAEIVYYDRALSAVEVAAHYTAGLGSLTVGAPAVVDGASNVSALGEGVAGAPARVDGETTVTAFTGGSVVVGAPAAVDGSSTVAATGEGVAGSATTTTGTTTVTAAGGAQAAAAASVAGATSVTALGEGRAGSTASTTGSTTVTATGGGYIAAPAVVTSSSTVTARGEGRAVASPSIAGATVVAALGGAYTGRGATISGSTTVTATGQSWQQSADIVGTLGRSSPSGVATRRPNAGAGAGVVAGRFRPYTPVGVGGKVSES